ncbi:O-antigen polysaccharide polymerase Wzy [Mesobacillus zeae]|uniref:O-antigen polysaccharide polymerase Wzy n=1 Tax=Mesobacillus zeae TaxID=1917180 RepID=A0A398B4M4_9BACI|nr:O-antigen polysaccharide polymerase Wzy [Mesobacillus zeae]RID82653.1 O-antigen polysaccharide polymerase Wzy [Mesobacillus zeae]
MIRQTNSNENKLKMSDVISLMLDTLILGISLIVVFSTKDRIETLPIIGYLIIGISIYLCFKVRKNEKLLFLFAIVSFINISIGFTDCINKGLYVSPWQIPLRESEYNSYTAKSILLFLCIINMFLSTKWLHSKAVNIRYTELIRRENLIIGYIGTILMFAILLMGYDTSVKVNNTYVSNSNPLIEYSVIIFAVVWLYIGKNKKLHFLLSLYAFLYILYSLSFGDRSAAFLMILLYYLLYVGNKIRLSLTRVFILAILAITLSNFIAEYRSGKSLEIMSMLQSAIQRGVYSDTVSYSYYASITISAVKHIDNSVVYFLQYLKTILLGGGSSEFGNLANFVKENYLYNVGGGLYTSYFYFGLGYPGVIMASAILGFIIRGVYSKKGNFAVLYQILIPVLSIRWYLYGPTSLYRSVFIIATFVLLSCIIFDQLVSKKRQLN